METRLIEVLTDFPYELIPIVAGYSSELPHAWIDADAVRNRHNFDDGWFRFVSTQTVGGGSNRWRIVTKFCSTDGYAWIAIGITTVATQDRRPTNWNQSDIWSSTATAADLLVRTSAPPIFAGVRMLKLFAGKSTTTDNEASTTIETTADVEVDWSCRSLIVRQVVGDRTVQIRHDLPSADTDDAVWRPTVVLAGSVTADILPNR